MSRLAALVHKWLALLVGVQMLLWVASGFFFTLYPIERVRSEHLIRKAAKSEISVPLGDLGAIRDSAGRGPTKLTIERRGERVVALAEFSEGPPQLYDAATLGRLSPLTAAEAAAIAADHVTVRGPPSNVTRVTAERPEYRGALPAWRVQFPDHGLAVYVAENTGAVTARRSDLWRLYDLHWAFHIMDWRNHEDFNHPLVQIAAALTLVSVLAGLILLPYRIRLPKRPAQSVRGEAR